MATVQLYRDRASIKNLVVDEVPVHGLEWVEFPLVINGTSVNPTLATTQTYRQALYAVQNKTMFLRMNYAHTVSAGVVEGVGLYYFLLPTGFTYDTVQGEVLGNGAVGNTFNQSACQVLSFPGLGGVYLTRSNPPTFVGAPAGGVLSTPLSLAQVVYGFTASIRLA